MSTQASIHDRFLRRDGRRLRWRIDGAGPALVLLHGWALDLDYFEPLVPLAAEQYTLLRFDRRGFGLSDGPPEPCLDAADLATVMDAAGITRAVVLGMSQGARLALRFARDFAPRVHALVLDGAPAIDAEPELPLAQFRARLEAGGAEALREAIRAHPMMQMRRHDEQRHALLETMLARYHGLDLLDPPGLMPAPDVAAIGVPVLLLHGTEDTATRRDAAAALADAIPGARRIALPGTGHLCLLDDPQSYAARLMDFLRSLPRWS